MNYLKNVSTITIDADKCRGCGMCLSVCPRNVLAKIGARVIVQERDACLECGACANNCPFEAAQVKPGVGCAHAIFIGMIRGTEPTCGDGSSSACCK